MENSQNFDILQHINWDAPLNIDPLSEDVLHIWDGFLRIEQSGNMEHSDNSGGMPPISSSPSQTPEAESDPEDLALSRSSSPSSQSSPSAIPALRGRMTGLEAQLVTLKREKEAKWAEARDQQREGGYPARTSGPKKCPQQEEHKEKNGNDKIDDLLWQSGIKNDTEKRKSARAKNRTKFKPERYYDPHPIQSRGEFWVSQATWRQFHYTPQGELDLHIKYSVDELKDFMENHFSHGTRNDALARGEPGGKASKLVLWIQHTPSDVAHRYPTRESSRCRFADCLDPKGSIRKGQFRVCFDEWNYDPASWRFDPYHNAGYVHLYCLEYFCDFPWICRNLNVQGDNRASKISRAEGINNFTIVRDRPDLLDVCNDFIKYSQSWPENVAQDGAYNAEWYKTTLSFALTTKHLALQTGAKHRTREQRNGNSIDKHLNNLHVWLDLEKEKKREAAVVRSANGGHPSIPQKDKKRMAAEEDKDVLHPISFGYAEEQNRAIKRPRLRF